MTEENKNDDDFNIEFNKAVCGILHNLAVFKDKMQMVIDHVQDAKEDLDVRLQYTMAAIVILYETSKGMAVQKERGSFKASDIVDMYKKFEDEFSVKE